MSSHICLDDPIPVEVKGKGPGLAIAWIDHGPRQGLEWVVLITETQETVNVLSSDIQIHSSRDIPVQH